MKIKWKRVIIIVLAVIIFCFASIFLTWQFLIPYDVLVSVRTPGFLFNTYDTYYEINSKLGITKMTLKLPEGKYILNADAYRYADFEEWEKHIDMTNYSYIKEYDPLMDYNRKDAANIHDYVYYYRIDDLSNYYRFSNETHEIKQIPVDTIDELILGGSDLSSVINGSGSIESLGYFDYYQGLNDAMSEHISLDDVMKPNLELSDTSFFLHTVVEINGRVFFNSGSRLFEFYPDTSAVKYIKSVRGNPQYINRFIVIGVRK